MKLSQIIPGKVYVVNPSGDLMIDKSKGAYVGKHVIAKEKTKSGKVVCALANEDVELSAMNLDLLP